MILKDDYRVLGCSKSDSLDTIKANYRKLLLKHHPDKNNGVHSEKIFEINKAYDNLIKQRSIVVDFRQNARQMVLRFFMLMKPRNIVLNVKVSIRDVYNGITKKITYSRFKDGKRIKDYVFINLNNFDNNQYIFKHFGDENSIANTSGDLHVNVSIDYQEFTNCTIDNIIDDYNVTLTLNINLQEYFTGVQQCTTFIVELPELLNHIPHIHGMSLSLPEKGLPFETEDGEVARGDLTVLLYLNLSNIPENINKDESFCAFLKTYFTDTPCDAVAADGKSSLNVDNTPLAS